MDCMSQLLHNQRSQIFILIFTRFVFARTQTHFEFHARALWRTASTPTHRAGAKKAVKAVEQMVAARPRTHIPNRVRRVYLIPILIIRIYVWSYFISAPRRRNKTINSIIAIMWS
jgi:hypothetical protein